MQDRVISAMVLTWTSLRSFSRGDETAYFQIPSEMQCGLDLSRPDYTKERSKLERGHSSTNREWH